MNDEFRRCPDCDELIRTRAKVCRFCGKSFDGESTLLLGTPPPSASPPVAPALPEAEPPEPRAAYWEPRSEPNSQEDLDNRAVGVTTYRPQPTRVGRQRSPAVLVVFFVALSVLAVALGFALVRAYIGDGDQAATATRSTFYPGGPTIAPASFAAIVLPPLTIVPPTPTATPHPVTPMPIVPRVDLTFTGTWDRSVSADWHGTCLFKKRVDGSKRPIWAEIKPGEVDGEPDIFTDGAWQLTLSSEDFQLAELVLFDSLDTYTWDGGSGTVGGDGNVISVDARMRAILGGSVRVTGTVTCPDNPFM